MSYTMATLTDQEATRQRAIVNQAYLWMTAGLLVTGAVASLTANSPDLLALIYGNTLVYFGLIIV
jgi:FtsH-binding integral membrane protein